MNEEFYARIQTELCGIKDAGTWKPERVLSSSQGAVVDVGGRSVLNLCSNNYLGLANEPRVCEAALDAIRCWGAGLASVRFICGTQVLHKDLERCIANFLGFEDAILFAAAFDANGGVFEPLLSEKDAVVSASLNHASIIDGVRLSKARRYRYAANDMDDLEHTLETARHDGARTIIVVTDGVFSMDGTIAQLEVIADLADKFGALTMVDDCHATGVIGRHGRGTAEERGVEGRVDIVSGTLGKALGGAMGGFVAARQEVIDLLRQRARPYLFSNALSPGVCGGAMAAITIARSSEGDERRALIKRNADCFRRQMADAGFELIPGEHAIIPVMLHDARLAQRMASELLDAGVLATGFSFPVVPRGGARIRTQMSAAHSPEHIDIAVRAFTKAGRKLRII